MKRYISLLISMAAVAICAAQTLQTEITVDRTVQPDLRDAVRPQGVTPALLPIVTGEGHLDAAEYILPSELTSSISVLPHAEITDTIRHTPYRGYAMLGYLPLYNVDFTAGYRLLDGRRYGLGIWAQYNGNSYHGDIPYFDNALFTNHSFTAGGDASYRFNRRSLLSASGRASYHSVRHPYFYEESDVKHLHSYTQGAKDLAAQLQWSSRAGSFVYAIKGAADYFSLDMKVPKELRDIYFAARQAAAHGTVNMGLAYDDTYAAPLLGIDADVSVIRSANMPYQADNGFVVYKTVDMIQSSIRPYFRIDNGTLQGRLGVNVAIGTDPEDKNKITVAPDVQIEWLPCQPVVFYGKLSGGQKFNYLNELFALNPYMAPYRTYGRSTMPIIIDGGINVGPYEGMSLSINGGYAVVRDYLAPLITIYSTGYMTSTFYNTDFDSWYVGANIGYTFRRLFSLGVGVRTGGSNNENRTWYGWIDAPKAIAEANVTVTPNDRLRIDLGYEMRYDRKAKSYIYEYQSSSFIKFVGVPNLGTVNNLKLGGSYAIYPWLTGFVSLENVLGVRTKLVSGMPDQRQHGLVGVACKF